MKRTTLTIILFFILCASLPACSNDQINTNQDKTSESLISEQIDSEGSSESPAETELPVTVDSVYERVVIIGVDGGGAYFKYADTPNLDRIFENGAVTYTALVSYPSVSAQGWGSILHGVTPDLHRLTNSVV